MTYGVENAESLHQHFTNGKNPFTETFPQSKPVADEPKRQIQSEAIPTDNLDECLSAALELASWLNHPQIDLLHIVVALALDENGRTALQEHGVDFEVAHKHSLAALCHVAPICPRLPPEELPKAHELQKVSDAAIALAMRRDPQQRTISIDDFVKAILAHGSKATLNTMRGLNGPSEEQIAFGDWQERVEGSLARIEQAHATPELKPANENTHIRHYASIAGIAALSIGVACLVYLSH